MPVIKFVGTNIGLAIMLCVVGVHAPTAAAAPGVTVINGNDSGPGSLREALASGAAIVEIDDAVSTINLESTLEYTGQAALRIRGSGQSVVADGDYTLLLISEGADVSISNLAFQGIGGFSAASQGIGKGIFVDVPSDRAGVVTLELKSVAVFDVANHGVHVSDCNLDDNCGAGTGGAGEGSSASIHAILTDVVVDGVGYGKFDADGVRIDDRDDGDIWFEAVGSTFQAVGADGVELDEGGSGDVIVDVRDTSFDDNGGYCLVVEANPELDPSCLEEGELDLDDGFDIDEAGDGSIYGVVRHVTVSSNLDEGLDYDEEGEGDIDLDLDHVIAAFNGDEGIKLSEVDAGDLAARLRTVIAVANNDDGTQFESTHAGRIAVSVKGSVTLGNAKQGLNVGQDDDLELGVLKVWLSEIADGIKTTNVESK
jgi:hypothetical protein